VTLILGFSSGLPLALSGSTLQAWYTTSGVSLKALGLMGLVGLPYTYKFLWAPLLDTYVPPFFGRRRGWMLIFQGLLAVTLLLMGCLTPDKEPLLLFVLACFLAFFSASQDVAIDAYRADILLPQERTLGASMVVNGYRTAMLISGGIALVLADHFGFSVVYFLMSGFMAVGMFGTLIGPNPTVSEPPRNFRESTLQPIKEFLSRSHAIIIILFVVFYELGNAFASSLIQPFLLRALHMTLSEIGTLVKFSGFIGIILGSLLAGILALRWNMYRAMFVFGILQALGNLGYLALLWTGPNYSMVGMVIFLDQFTGGMGQAALVGFLMSLCNPRFTAFQYATLSSLGVLGRVFMGPLAGFIAEEYGWVVYFLSSVVLSLPGLFLLWKVKSGLQKIKT
jgi:PAT family beta-lactamase induction signal transducer AmpG